MLNWGLFTDMSAQGSSMDCSASGALHRMMRIYFCREDQIEEEILRVLDFTLFVLKTFGFDSYDIYLSTRPEKYVGSDDNWEISTNALKWPLR